MDWTRICRVCREGVPIILLNGAEWLCWDCYAKEIKPDAPL